MSTYRPVVAKNGPKLTESKPADARAMTSSNHSVVANRIALPILAGLLSGPLDRLVVDSIGLQGTFDVHLDWTPDAATTDAAPLGPSLFAAIQEQLRLKLEATLGPVEVIVVDHAEETPTEN